MVSEVFRTPSLSQKIFTPSNFNGLGEVEINRNTVPPSTLKDSYRPEQFSPYNFILFLSL